MPLKERLWWYVCLAGNKKLTGWRRNYDGEVCFSPEHLDFKFIRNWGRVISAVKIWLCCFQIVSVELILMRLMGVDWFRRGKNAIYHIFQKNQFAASVLL